MATSSILGGATPATYPEGRDIGHLGPSDSSDSGSDVQSLGLEADTDAAGTGERPSAEPGFQPDGADILPDSLSEEDPDALAAADVDVEAIAAEEDDEEEDEEA